MNEGFNVFITGMLTDVVILLGSLALNDNWVTVETDKLTNTKYIEYKDTIYTLVLYKNIIKEK